MNQVLAFITVALAAGTVFFAGRSAVLTAEARRTNKSDRTGMRLERTGLIVDEILQAFQGNPLNRQTLATNGWRLQFSTLGLTPDLPECSKLMQMLGIFEVPPQLRATIGPEPTSQEMRNQCHSSLREIEVKMGQAFVQDPTQPDPERWTHRPNRRELRKAKRNAPTDG